MVEECSRCEGDINSVKVQGFGLMIDADGEILTER